MTESHLLKLFCRTKVFFIFLFITALDFENYAYALPAGFVYLKDIDPTIIQDIKYYSTDNFVGRRIKGYDAPKCILTYETALALSKLQSQLRQKAMGLKVYDCYRPSMAVDDFITWSHDTHEQQQKKKYYPLIDKANFFKLGYVASKSGHSRGSTVDLTLVDLDMGTHFDFMDERSHTLNAKVSSHIRRNRLLLRAMMVDAGFSPIETEWWHFTFKSEPFPRTYFNFPVI
jgi:D-alanyl-D-alanine dipeptidase